LSYPQDSTRVDSKADGARSSARKKIFNLVFFALLVFAAILIHGTWNLYDIARRPLPHHETPPKNSAASRLEARVRKLAGEIGRRNYEHASALNAAAEYIRRELTSAGYAVQEQPYSVRPPGTAIGSPMRNLIAVLPAGAANAPVLVIGAHYDTAPNTPGADDNASGIAILIELAQRLKDLKGNVEIRFVAFSTEEPPFFGTPQMGSAWNAHALKAEGRPVAGMVSLEMLGYYDESKGSQKYPPGLSLFFPDRGNFVGAVSNLRSRKFLSNVTQGYAPPLGTPMVKAGLPEWIGEIGLSDHKCYWNEGFPAVMITDTAFLRYAHYHGPTDTPEKLDYVRMADVTVGLEAALRGFVQHY
jgi:hypothetical protein